MDFDQIKELVELIDQSDLTEFNLQVDNVVVRMSKLQTPSVMNLQPDSPNLETIQDESVQQEQDALKSVLQDEENFSSKKDELETDHEEGQIIQSPLVGVAYLSPEPGQPSYKRVGDTVKAGDTLCIVEAMKLMNEIKSEIDGTIAEILVEEEQVVEYSQPLFRIV